MTNEVDIVIGFLFGGLIVIEIGFFLFIAVLVLKGIFK